MPTLPTLCFTEKLEKINKVATVSTDILDHIFVTKDPELRGTGPMFANCQLFEIVMTRNSSSN